VVDDLLRLPRRGRRIPFDCQRFSIEQMFSGWKKQLAANPKREGVELKNGSDDFGAVAVQGRSRQIY